MKAILDILKEEKEHVNAYNELESEIRHYKEHIEWLEINSINASWKNIAEEEIERLSNEVSFVQECLELREQQITIIRQKLADMLGGK